MRMPSGRYVTAQAFCDFGGECVVNVAVHALGIDRGVSQGLCGNFDGDAQNDLTQGGLSDPSYPEEPIQLSTYFL